MPDRKRLPPPPDQQSSLADMLSGVSDLMHSINPFGTPNFPQGRNPGFPQGRYPSLMSPEYHSFNERFTRTPGIVVPSMPRDVEAQYFPPSGYPGEGWGTIRIKPDTKSNTISHEAAHSLYNRAALYRWGSGLEDNMDPAIAKMLEKPYRRQIANNPSVLSDEGLGYSMNSPTPQDEAYVNYVASRIKDPAMRQQLLNLFQHAKAMSTPEWTAEKKELHQKPRGK